MWVQGEQLQWLQCHANGFILQASQGQGDRERKREICCCHYQTLLSLHLMYIKINFSEAHQSQLRHTPYSTNIVSLSKLWPSDDRFANVPERNQHLYMLIHCILFQIILIISILCFFASNYCFLSCWLAIIISPGINLIWNKCMFPVALSTLKIIYPANVRNNVLSFILTFRKGLWISMCWQVPTWVQAVNPPK